MRLAAPRRWSLCPETAAPPSRLVPLSPGKSQLPTKVLHRASEAFAQCRLRFPSQMLARERNIGTPAHGIVGPCGIEHQFRAASRQLYCQRSEFENRELV